MPGAGSKKRKNQKIKKTIALFCDSILIADAFPLFAFGIKIITSWYTMPKSRSRKSKKPDEATSSGTGTLVSCLTIIGVPSDALLECANLEDEFKLIKKCYFKEILIAHPDKGGDAEKFRQINEAFQKIREAFEKRAVTSFSTESTTFAPDDFYTTYTEDFTKSYDFYWNAAEEEVPLYKVELAKSGRSKCVQKGKEAKKCDHPWIEKSTIRVGSINLESGSYGRWCHLMCWRVPSKIWEGLPDPDTCRDDAKFEAALSSMNEVLLCGFNQLSPEHKSIFISHVKDKDNWASITRRKPLKVDDTDEANGSKAKTNTVKASTATSSKTDNQENIPEFVNSASAAAELEMKTKPDFKSKESDMKPSSKRKSTEIAKQTVEPDSDDDDKSLLLLRPAFASSAFARPKTNVPAASSAIINTDIAKPQHSTSTTAAKASKSNAVVVSKKKKKGYWSMPPISDALVVSKKNEGYSLVPGRDGAQPNFFSKKTIVMTGVFPEIGGGTGLNLGKDRLKAILESFGAKVTGSVSGRTDFLIVGREPGMSKVSKARAQPKCQLLDIFDMKLAVEGKKSLVAIEAPTITNYSLGYQGNGLGRIGY